MPKCTWSIGRHLLAPAIVFGVLSSTADASVIWIFKETETVSTSVSVSTLDGATLSESHQSSSSVLTDPLVSQLSVNANRDNLNLPSAYFDGMDPLGSSAAVTQSGSTLEVNAISGYGGCSDLACSQGLASAGVDLTFRPGNQSAMRVDYHPAGGFIDAMLIDLTAGVVVHQAQGSTLELAGTRFVFEFPDNHLYRWVASGTSSSPPAGDPEAYFSTTFYDRVIGADSDIAPVPEPVSMVLLGTGLAGIFLRRRMNM